ncbi:MAG: sodium-dependent transporter [Bacteroidaceae bacterium]|jgi:NSS family neurotransmitter:Na+ symporter
MTPNQRANFGSRIGAILASAGSAVGLGNIWRFPTQTGENGGAAFILVYILCVLIMGMPVMISEFIIGRRARANTAASYRVLAPGTRWVWVGRLGVLTGFLILSYYAVVAGWTLEYTVASLIGRFNGMSGSDEFKQYFADFTSNPITPVVYTIIFLVLTHLVVVRGVQKGIERSSKIFMPVFFLLLIVLVVCALTMPGAGQAMRFLFTPDFSKIDSGVVLAAMGQAFFSLSLGMGCLCTYASYFSRNTRLGQTALSVGAIDTFVAVMAGLMIFPAVFSVEGVGVDAGPSLLFITLPSVLQSAFGGMPILGYLFALLFYVLLVLATLTSTISLHEVVTAYLVEEFGFTRPRAATLITVGCSLLGTLCALSMGVLKPYTVAGLTLFDLFDFVTAKLMLPIGAFFICLFVGWKLERHVIESEVTNEGSLRFPLLRPLVFLIRYIVPVLIALIFLNELGAEIF